MDNGQRGEERITYRLDGEESQFDGRTRRIVEVVEGEVVVGFARWRSDVRFGPKQATKRVTKRSDGGCRLNLNPGSIYYTTSSWCT